jgi:Rnl2 family RNA ligase
MEFRKYSSIENSYREKEIKKIYDAGFASKDIKWVATEKVHGTNFSFICNGQNVICAKRTSVLNGEELDRFYDADIMLEKYKDNVLNLFEELTQRGYPNLKRIQIYGEHFGGIFNSEKAKGYTTIQKGIEYIPFTDFIVFDIYVVDNEKENFLNWNFLKKVAEKTGFNVVPELFIGTFEECINYPNFFPSKIPEMYGLESKEDNIAEGIVLKPIEPLFFKTGERVILKSKNEKFKEKGRIKKHKENKQLTEEEQKWVDEITKYFEIPRIESVLSKGDAKLDWKQFGKLNGLFFKDALEDFIKDNPQYLELDKGVKKVIQKEAQKVSSDFIREFMKKRI